MTSNTISRFLLAPLLLSAAVVGTARAQDLYVGSNSTVLPVSYTSGSNGFGNIFVGYGATASNNVLGILKGGTILSNSNNLVVGAGGSGNNMTIFVGGVVLSTGVSTVGSNATSSNNSVSVNGSGSLWSNAAALVVGAGGSGNSLQVLDQAQVISASGIIGSNAASSNNSVLVSGALWSNSSTLVVGNAGGGTLTVANAGIVSASGITVASLSGSSGVLNIGSLGGTDSGATIQSPTITFGSGSGSINFNQTGVSTLTANISGAGSVNQLGLGNAILAGTNTYTGGTRVIDGVLSVTTTTALPGWNTSGSYFVGSFAGLALGNAISDANYATIHGTTNFAIRALLGFDTTAGNRTFTNALINIGYNALGLVKVGANTLTITSTGNTYTGATLVDGGSLLVSGKVTRSGALIVGNTNSNISLIVTNGGIFNSLHVTVAAALSATNNSLQLTGSNTAVNSTGDLFVGNLGNNNSMVISGGARLTNGQDNAGGVIGFGTNASNNTVLVTGVGSRWSNSGNLIVGASGSANALTVAASASLVSTSAIIGSNAIANNNSVYLAGTDTSGVISSSWSNTGSLTVGLGGSSNSLTLDGGAVGTAGFISIGSLTNANDNRVTVSGTGTLGNPTALNIAGSLVVGDLGSYNSLLVNTGAIVTSASGVIGNTFGSENSVDIENGAVWSNAGSLTLGNDSQNNSLYVGYNEGNGGTLISTSAVIGATVNGNHNKAYVDTALWSNTGSLIVGQNGSYNYLYLGSEYGQGTLVSGSAVIGSTTNSEENYVYLYGGSVWSNTGSLVIGDSGLYNELYMYGGSTLTTASAIISSNAASSENDAYLHDAGTLWSNTGILNVGLGAYGSLQVERGATVISGGGIILGGTTNGSGDLDIGGNNQTAGQIITPTITFGPGGGYIYFEQSNNAYLAANISGYGSVYQRGSGPEVGWGVSYLSGTNTYDQGTTIESGVLAISSINALPGWNTNGAYSVQANAGLAVGDAVTDSQITTMLASGNFQSNALFGFDTTSSNRTYTNVLGNTINGALGLVKVGANTLTITAANTYTGGTLVNGGYSNGALVMTGSASNFTVGATNSSSYLYIYWGGTLADSNGYVASGATTPTGSTVLISDAGSLWTNSSSLTVGTLTNGIAATVTIENKATVAAPQINLALLAGSVGTINVGALGGTNMYGNQDAGMSLAAGTITFGSGSGTLNFNQYGAVTLTSSIQGGNSNSSVNQLGAGSTVLSGNNSFGGSVQVSAGTLVAASTNALGVGSVTLTGGSLNLQTNLTISSLVWNSSAIIQIPTSLSNQLSVLGSVSLTGGTNYFDLGVNTLSNQTTQLLSYGSNPGNFLASSFGITNLAGNNGYTLALSNNALWLNFTSLYIGSNSVSQTNTYSYIGTTNAGNTYVGYSTGSTSTNNALNIGNSTMVIVGNLYDGHSGNGVNQVNVGQANLTVNGTTYLGYSSNTVSNTLSIGSGYIKTLGDLYVGYASASNTATAGYGGNITVNGNTYVGYGSNAASNAIIVNSISGSFDTLGNLQLGVSGSGSLSVIASGGSAVVGGNTTLGVNASSSNNSLLVIYNDTFSTASNLVIGLSGSENSVQVLTSGSTPTLTVGGQTILGQNAGSSNNSLTIAGYATWSNGGDLVIGQSGSRNSVQVSGQGQTITISGQTTLGQNAGSSNNSLSLAGYTTWSNSGNIVIGASGNGTMTIRDGTALHASNIVIAQQSGSSGTLLVNPSSGYSGVTIGAGTITLGAGAATLNFNQNGGDQITINSIITGGNSNSQILVTGGGKVELTTASTNSAFLIVNGGSLFLDTNYTSSQNIVVGTSSNAGTMGNITSYVNLTSAGSITVGATTASGNSLTVQQSVMNASNGVFVGTSSNGNNNLYLNQGTLNTTSVLVGGGARNRISGSGTITAPGGVTINGSLYPQGSTALTVNGNLTFTNGGNYIWSIYNSTNTGPGVNFAATLGVNGTFAASTNSTFGLNIGYNALSVDPLWFTTNVVSFGAVMTNLAGNSMASGTNMTIVFDPYTSQRNGFSTSDFFLTASNNALYLNFQVAQTYFKTNSGAWTNSASWSNTLPNSGTDVTIDNGGTSGLNASGSALNMALGYNSSSNSLLITNGGSLNVNGSTAIGDNASSTRNIALVNGAGGGATWTNGSGLYVGYNGASNSLIVTNGGSVQNGLFVEGFNSTSSNNSVVVTGSNSVLASSTDFYVGQGGTGNTLVISNGGKVVNGIGNFDSDTQLGGVIGAKGYGNRAIVTGTGSLWSNSSAFSVGAGAGNESNSLTISAGGTVVDYSGYVGQGGSGNSAVLTGAGSLWSNANAFTVGVSGSNNSLVVSSGASLIDSLGIIGDQGGGSNTVLLTGSGSSWSNSGSLTVGNLSSGNSLVVTNGAKLVESDLYVGNQGGNNTLTVDGGSGTYWSNNGTIAVGISGNGNTLTLQGSGTVTGVTQLLIGNNGTSNSVVISGNSSMRTTNSYLEIGQNGTGNSLTVSNNSKLTGVSTINLGNSGSGNTLTLAGGSLLNNVSSISLGSSGNNNSLVISGGSWLSTTSTPTLDIGPSGSGNSLIVSGSSSLTGVGAVYIGQSGNNDSITIASNSIITASVLLNLGDNSSGDSLIISNGSSLTGITTISSGGNSGNQSLIITGSNSVLNASGLLDFGQNGGNNLLLISNGGKLTTTLGELGDYNGSASAVVTGSNSLWSNSAGGITLGYDTYGNGSLTVANGGTVVVQSNGIVFASGYQSAGTLNFGTLGGSDTTGYLVGVGTLTFGTNSNSISSTINFNQVNALTFTNGIASGYGYVNQYGSGTTTMSGMTNTYTGGTHVDGGGLLLLNASLKQYNTNMGNLTYVGDSANNSTLILSNSKVYDAYAYVGNGYSSNTAVVAGSNSLWSNSSTMYVGEGNNSTYNSLSIQAGGTVLVSGGDLVVGSGSGTTNNSLALNNGQLQVAGNLYIGQNGYNAGQNTLVATSGSSIAVTNWLYIGYNDSFNSGLVDSSSISANGIAVGDGGNNNSLILTNKATLISTEGYIGNQFQDSGNRMILNGVGTTWSNADSIYVGEGGYSNSLIITNGAFVSSSNTYIGYYNDPYSYAVVSKGATLTNSGTLIVGDYDGSNYLLVNNYGSVFASNVVIGQYSSGSNSAMISDSGTLMSVQGNLTIGQNENNDSLTVNRGANLIFGSPGSTLYVGNGGSYNSLIVSDAGTSISGTNTSQENLSLYVGSSGGMGNSLVITNGAQVLGGSGYIGDGGSSGNFVLVTGQGSLWSNSGSVYVGDDQNSGGSGTLTVTAQGAVFTTNLYVAYGSGSSGTVNIGAFGGSDTNITLSTPVITFGQGVGLVNFNQAYTLTNNSIFDGVNNSTYDIIALLGSGTTVLTGVGGTNSASIVINSGQLIINGGAFTSTSGSVYVGVQGQGGIASGYSNSTPVSMLITNGGHFGAGNLYVGYGASSGSGNNGNSVLISNSTMTIGTTQIGEYGNSNSVVITGTNSIWTNTGYLYVGNNNGYTNTYGLNNSLVISNGAKVYNDFLYAGYYGSYESAQNGNNTVLVTGTNSTLSNSGGFYIGYYENGDTITVTNGAKLYGYDDEIGYYGNNNTLLIAGSNSLYSNSSSLYVGDNDGESGGFSNSLIISNGASAIVSQTYFGYESYTNGYNTALVTGTNSLFSNSAGFYLGYYENGDTITVTNGAKLYGNNDYIGDGYSPYGGDSNQVLVTGSNSLYSNSGSLYIGYNDDKGPGYVVRGNSLTISNEAVAVVANGTYIGDYSATNGNNSVLVTGTNSTFSNSSKIYIGYGESGDFITVTNGAKLYGHGDEIGYEEGGNSNTLIVTGTNSLYSNSSYLYVGDTCYGNSLIISNGATAYVAGTTYVGDDTGDIGNNTILVMGSSTLNLAGGFRLGYLENGDAITVTNGAKLYGNNDYIGYYGSSNTLIVTGSNSLYSNASSLYIGYGGQNNSLTVTNGASASVAGNLYVGYTNGDNINSLIVYGNSTLTVGSNSYIGGNNMSNSTANNSVVITGANARWTNGSDVNIMGSYNSLTVNSGAVLSAGGQLDIGNEQGTNGGSNTVIVTGPGSSLNAASGVWIGDGANNNLMIVSNGATVTANQGYVGDYTSVANDSGNSNRLIVTGTNSLFTNYGNYFAVGDGSSGNSMVITNGARFFSMGNFYLGDYYGSNNSVIIAGDSSLLSNSGTIFVGATNSSGNTLALNDPPAVYASNVVVASGNLLTGSGTITARTTTINGTLAPVFTNALTINGNLSFGTNGIYLWSLLGNTTNAPGTNYTTPVALYGNLSVSNGATITITLGSAVNFSDTSFWGVNQAWTVLTATSPATQGGNFSVVYSSNSSPAAGIPIQFFTATNNGNNLILTYEAPLVTNVETPAGTTNTLPAYNATTVVVNNGAGTTYLATNNPGIVSTIVNAGTLVAPTTNALPAGGDVTVNGGTLVFQGPGTNTINNYTQTGGTNSIQTGGSNSIISVNGFVMTGGTLAGGTNATFWAANYVFQATNTASVGDTLANLGTVANYHSTALVTTNPNGAPVAPVVFNTDMSYDGGTVITGGILQLGSSNSTGAVTVQGAITNNGYLNYGYNGNSTTPTNTVIGSGVIGQVGTGTLTVGTNGIDNAFTGSFSAANGTLALSSNSALGAATNFYLASSGTLQATTGVTNITQSIQVTNGTGTVQNSGTGTLVLSGPVSITGAEIVFKGGNGINVTGSISGSDPVIDGGVTTWSAVNTFNAATYIIDGGTLNAAVANALPTANGRSAVYIDQTNGGTSYGTGSSTLSLGANQSVASLSGASSSLVNLLSHQLTIGTATGSTTYAGVISGTGSLLKDSASTQILTGANTYSGGTTVTNGTLVTVNTSALGSGDVSLGGTGTLQLRSLLTIGAFNWSGGQVAIPTLTSTNGVYLASTNGLTIPGGSHVFNLSGASLTIGTPTRLLGATNMSTNSFSTNEFTVTGVGNYSLLISNDILWIDLLNNPAPSPTAVVYPNFVSYAANRNQVNVATALNSFTNSPNADQTIVLNSLTALTNSPGSMQQAFNAIMPNFYQQMATIAFNSANAQNMELSQRLWGMRVAEGGGFSMNGFGDNTPMIQEGQGDGDGKGVLDAKKDILRPGLDNRWGMFLDANGIFAQANSGNMLPGYQSESGGVTTGLTYKWNKNVSSGIYAGYQGTYNKLGAAGSGLGVGSTLIDNAVRFGFFGTYGQVNSKGEPLGFYANALAGGAYNNYQASRIIQYPGINRTATSQPGAGELDSMIAGGYDLKAGNFTYGPSASLQYTYLGANGVNETGAQSLDYNSSGWNSSSMLSSVGAHGAYTWMVKKLEGHEVAVVPQISLSWQHEFMQNPYAINGNLGGTTPNFSNWSATPIRDFLYTGVGVTVEFAKRWNTSFFYNAAAGNKDLVSQSIFLSAGLKF
jgi:T5SS/PEP-CTERM-associated repeat protein